jgi:hypothetical protein
MKSLSKLFGTVVAAALIAGTFAGQASAQSNNNTGPRTGLFGALLGPVGVAAAVGTSTSTMAWTTIATKTWTYPWKGFVGGAVQGVNATGQYVHNVLNPHYFNESLHLDNIFHQKSGVHSTSADYKQHHSKTTKSKLNQGKMIVGCIMGSAFGAITASMRKATALGNPPRWRSQAEHERIVASGYEKQFELTSDEASTALALCGLGSLALNWQPRQRP